MDFLDALNNVTEAKRLPKRGEVGSMVWGIKRALSMRPAILETVAYLDQFHFSLGDDRFYELLVWGVPGGRFQGKSVKKPEEVKGPLSEELAGRIASYFKVLTKELPVLLAVLRNRGTGIDDLKAFFGVNEGGHKKAKPLRIQEDAPKGGFAVERVKGVAGGSGDVGHPHAVDGGGDPGQVPKA